MKIFCDESTRSNACRRNNARARETKREREKDDSRRAVSREFTELRPFVGFAMQNGQSAMTKVGMAIQCGCVCARERERERESARGFKLFRKPPEERRLGAKLRDNSRRALIDLVIVDTRARVHVAA